MAIQVTTYSPDHCQCSVEFEWEDTLPADLRIHTLRRVIQRGPEHAAILDATLYAVILDENIRKNRTLGILESFGFVQNADNIYPFNWAFTPGRVLQVNFRVQVSANRKSQIQTECDLQFGPTRVQIL